MDHGYIKGIPQKGPLDLSFSESLFSLGIREWCRDPDPIALLPRSMDVYSPQFG